ncbi:hypothetical protein FACS1894123_12230 [Bacteroidia bacterium]|nr:hypothetical protein FACS1894123_12230 [Bacteroidia bacterium]
MIFQLVHKGIGHDGFTILSNNDTGKMAMMVECTQADGVEQAMIKLGTDLQKIRNISMDMSPTYALVFNDLVPRAVPSPNRLTNGTKKCKKRWNRCLWKTKT